MTVRLDAVTFEVAQVSAVASGLGGRHLDVGQGPEDGFVELADPDGNELILR